MTAKKQEWYERMLAILEKRQAQVAEVRAAKLSPGVRAAAVKAVEDAAIAEAQAIFPRPITYTSTTWAQNSVA